MRLSRRPLSTVRTRSQIELASWPGGCVFRLGSVSCFVGVPLQWEADPSGPVEGVPAPGSIEPGGLRDPTAAGPLPEKRSTRDPPRYARVTIFISDECGRKKIKK